jgi:hypothetical protein
MKSVKQRKHKKNNSLREYKKKNKKVSLNYRKKISKKMTGGAGEIKKNDDAFDFSGKNLDELKEFKGDLNGLINIINNLLTDKPIISLEDLETLIKYYDFTSREFFEKSDDNQNFTIKPNMKDKIRGLKNDIETINANVVEEITKKNDSTVLNPIHATATTATNTTATNTTATNNSDTTATNTSDTSATNTSATNTSDTTATNTSATNNFDTNTIATNNFDTATANPEDIDFELITQNEDDNEQVNPVDDTKLNQLEEKIKENENEIDSLKKQKDSQEIRIKKITETSLKIDSQNAKIVTDLQNIQNELSSSIQDGNNCQIESNKLKLSIEKLTTQNLESETSKNELKREIEQLQKFNTEIQETQNAINESLSQEKIVLKTKLTEQIQTGEKFKSALDESVKKTIEIKKYISKIWNNIGQKCVELNGKCDFLQKWDDTNSPLNSLTLLNDNLNKIFDSTKTQIKMLKTEKMDSDKKIKEVSLEKEKIESERDQQIKNLTETHDNAIQSHKEEKDELNEKANNLTTDIKNITEERDAFKTELLTNALNNQNKIVVTLDTTQFYTDVCKNIKNIIINAYFLDMLFDKQLESKPETPLAEGSEKSVQPDNTLSQPEEARPNNTKRMKEMVLYARENLNLFLTDLVKQLGLPEDILSDIQTIDKLAAGALGSNMASYLFAASFFSVMAMGGKGNSKRRKTLRSLGLHNKKQTKSLRSMTMKGGTDSDNNKANLDNLITKVITDICQQMELTKNLLSYITDVQIEMESFELSLQKFIMVYKERNSSNKKELEPITNFLVPYKESQSENSDINKFKNEIELFLRERNQKEAKVETILNDDTSTIPKTETQI